MCLEATKKYRPLVSGKHLSLSYGKLKIFFDELLLRNQSTVFIV